MAGPDYEMLSNAEMGFSQELPDRLQRRSRWTVAFITFSVCFVCLDLVIALVSLLAPSPLTVLFFVVVAVDVAGIAGGIFQSPIALYTTTVLRAIYTVLAVVGEIIAIVGAVILTFWIDYKIPDDWESLSGIWSIFHILTLAGSLVGLIAACVVLVPYTCLSLALTLFNFRSAIGERKRRPDDSEGLFASCWRRLRREEEVDDDVFSIPATPTPNTDAALPQPVPVYVSDLPPTAAPEPVAVFVPKGVDENPFAH